MIQGYRAHSDKAVDELGPTEGKEGIVVIKAMGV